MILAHLLCNDGSIEADCTNLELGTKVECGDIFVNDVDLPILSAYSWLKKLRYLKSNAPTFIATFSSSTGTQAPTFIATFFV